MSRPGSSPGTPRLFAALVLVAWCLAMVLTEVSTAAAAPTQTDPVGVWPLQPEPAVVRGFDPPDSPYGSGHRGVDLAGAVGQPVLAALPGTVTYAGMLAGRGVVVVGHGATRTTYEPVSAVVAVGAVVAAGSQIGTLELARSHCFPDACLHWGWVAGSAYLDPLRLVGVLRVRLLPLWRELPAAVPVASSSDSWGAVGRGAVPAYSSWLMTRLTGLMPLAALTAQARGCACW